MLEREVMVTNSDEARKSISGYLRRDIKSMPLILGLLRAPILLVELGVTAAGLIMVIDWLSKTRSYWSSIPHFDDDVAWTLGIDVVLALWLAARFERRRWIRSVSVIFHVALVILVLVTLVGFYTNPND